MINLNRKARLFNIVLHKYPQIWLIGAYVSGFHPPSQIFVFEREVRFYDTPKTTFYSQIRIKWKKTLHLTSYKSRERVGLTSIRTIGFHKIEQLLKIWTNCECYYCDIRCYSAYFNKFLIMFKVLYGRK